MGRALRPFTRHAVRVVRRAGDDQGLRGHRGDGAVRARRQRRHRPRGGGLPDDWDRVYGDSSNATASDFITDAIDSSASEHLFQGGGSKDGQPISAWKWKTGAGVQDKNDIEDAYASAYTSADGHRIVYFGQDRYATSGDAFVGFWFLQDQVSEHAGGTFDGAHVDGDILVQVNFTNGGAIQTFLISKWQSGGLVSVANGVECNGTTNDFACGKVNGDGIGSITSPWPFTAKSGGPGMPQGAFFEGGIDLTHFGLDNSCFSTFVAETRSSQSLTSTLSDYALGGFSFVIHRRSRRPPARRPSTSASP